MDRAVEQSQPSRPHRRTLILGCVCLLALAGVVGFLVWSKRGKTRLPEIATIYRNARAGVRYLGDESCTRCHAEIAATYAQHPMGRSIFPIDQAPPEVRGQEKSQAVFQALGMAYSLENRQGKTYHQESKRDQAGQIIGEVEGEARYVLGSGRHAFAFLIQRDDYLFQSPLTWYSQSKRWDLAPAFEGREARFERQISPKCLVCHANQVDHVEGTEGRYRAPIFRGHSIGCERCHGPGELHVAHPTDESKGPNIVNPRKLEPELRADVCRQCHLLGETTVERFGRTINEYRPGLPFNEFITVFVKGEQAESNHPNADHVEQMERSRCFQESKGELGCVSCHDPHELPAPALKVSYYRARCLNCHNQRGCSLPEPTRLAQDKEDSCIACHMPRASTSDVPHVSTTLHSIPKLAATGLAQIKAQRDDHLSKSELIPYRRDQMTEAQRRSTDRDLGVAIRHDRSEAPKALPLLEAAILKQPDDLLARESLGFVLWALGRDEQALATFENVLKSDPDRESSLEAAALVASKLRRYDQSVGLWQRAIATDPWRSSFFSELAYDLTRLQKWDEARTAANRALALNPASQTARTALILSNVRTGQPQEARAQFNLLLKFNPPDPEGLTRWFGSLR